MGGRFGGGALAGSDLKVLPASDDSWEWVLAHRLMVQVEVARLALAEESAAEKAPLLALGPADQPAAAVGSHWGRRQDAPGHCQVDAWHHLAGRKSAHSGLLAELQVVRLALAERAVRPKLQWSDIAPQPVHR